MNIDQYLEISAEVKEALKQNKPVVALESTIISHGMPYPQNVETALNVEQIIRDNGAVPCTCAIINGKLKAGLSKEEIEILGKLRAQQKFCDRIQFTGNNQVKVYYWLDDNGSKMICIDSSDGVGIDSISYMADGNEIEILYSGSDDVK